MVGGSVGKKMGGRGHTSLILVLCSLMRPRSISSLPAAAVFDASILPACCCHAADGPSCFKRLRGGEEIGRRSRSAPSGGGTLKHKRPAQALGNLTDDNMTSGLEVLGSNTTISSNQGTNCSPITVDDFRCASRDARAPCNINSENVIDIPYLSFGFLQQQRARFAESASSLVSSLFGWCAAPGAVGSYCRWRAANYWQALELEITFILCPHLLAIWAVAAKHTREPGDTSTASDNNRTEVGTPIVHSWDSTATALAHSAHSAPGIVLWAGMRKLFRVPASPSPVPKADRKASRSACLKKGSGHDQDRDPGKKEEWLWQALIEGRWSEVKWTGVAVATAACVGWLLAPRALLVPVRWPRLAS